MTRDAASEERGSGGDTYDKTGMRIECGVGRATYPFVPAPVCVCVCVCVNEHKFRLFDTH
jgi:hypothetical protein